MLMALSVKASVLLCWMWYIHLEGRPSRFESNIDKKHSRRIGLQGFIRTQKWADWQVELRTCHTPEHACFAACLLTLLWRHGRACVTCRADGRRWSYTSQKKQGFQDNESNCAVWQQQQSSTCISPTGRRHGLPDELFLAII